MLDRAPTQYHLPRAVHFDDEVMRVFQTVGIAEDLLSKVRVNPGMKFVDDADRLLLDWPRPQDITLHGWNASYRLHQPDLEALLRQQLARVETADIRTGVTIRSLDTRDDHVALHGVAQAGTPQTFAARYVVGCDGAQSLTRQTIGSVMEDFGFEERWLVLDLILKRPRPDLGDHSIQFCSADRPITYCRNPGQRRRWEIRIKDSETDTEITAPARVWQLLSRWITPRDAELERSAVYTFRSQVARSWRAGPVLIAGDAAHLTPPSMGQGMCTGIRDAANLAWKLVACLKGADDSLLDTYASERAPHAQAYVDTAKRLGGLINTLDQASAMRLAEDQRAGRSQMRSIAPRLGHSPLADGTSHPAVGRPFGQIDLGAGQRAFDARVGYGHLIIGADRPAQLPDTVLWMDPAAHPALAVELRALDAGAVWVRPDRYIGAIADSATDLLAPLKRCLPQADASATGAARA